MNDLKLCFIKKIGINLKNEYQYEFLFTDKIDEVWGENFEMMPASICNNLIPNEEDYNEIKTLSMKHQLILIQDSCCFSIQDCMDGIISLGYAYDDNKIILNLKYGETLDEIENKLANLNMFFDYEK